MNTLQVSKKIIYLNLEGLRGFAALLVLWCHAIGYFHYLDPHYTPYGVFAYQAPAHFSVLIFFVLSGYVIGVSNKAPLTGSTIWLYCKKRLTRIYPIYLISIVIALVIAANTYPLWTILGNISFLQVAITPVIWEINPIWSLNSEMLFYLLFIPVSALRLNLVGVTLFSLIIGLLNLWFLPHHPLLSTYAFGFTFWMCGLLLAQYRSVLPTYRSSYQLLFSTMLLFVSFSYYNYLGVLFDAFTGLIKLNLHYPVGSDLFESIINAYDFVYLPYAVIGILLFIDKRLPGSNFILPVLWLLPAFSFIHIVEHWRELNSRAIYLLPTLTYAVSLLLFFGRLEILEKIGSYLISKFIWLGSISYGLYIIHLPIMSAFKRVEDLSGSGLSFTVRFFSFLLLSILSAWILEKRVQPVVKRLLS